MAQLSQNGTVTLISFGFKYGVPAANYYFDVGFLKNPARDQRWDFFSEPTAEMRQYVLDQDHAKRFLEMIQPLIIFLATIDQNQVFAFGCNSGRHRSSILVDELGRRLNAAGVTNRVVHRDRGE